MKLVEEIDSACLRAHVDRKYAQPLTCLLMKVIADGLDGIEDQRSPSLDHIESLKHCLNCVDSDCKLQSIACEEWSDDVDIELFGEKKKRVDIVSFVWFGSEIRAVLVEGKLGCSVNESGKNTQPRHADLKEKFDTTCCRLTMAGCEFSIHKDLYLLVSGLYKNQIARRVFMWHGQGLIPKVKCLCCQDLMSELGISTNGRQLVGCSF